MQTRGILTATNTNISHPNAVTEATNNKGNEKSTVNAAISQEIAILTGAAKQRVEAQLGKNSTVSPNQ